MNTSKLNELYAGRADLDKAIRNSHTLITEFKQHKRPNDFLECMLSEYEIIDVLRRMKEKIEKQIQIEKQENNYGISQ